MKYIQSFESVTTKDKNKEIFNYSSQLKELWFPVIKDAKNFQNISFDLENNDSTGQKKTIRVKKNLRIDQPVKYVINAELCKAGGDWEYPVMYFKLEFETEYSLKNPNKYKSNPKFVWDLDTDNKLYNKFVLIPPVEAGNKLVKTDSGWRAYQDDDLTKETKKIAYIKEDDEKKAWKWLEKTLEDAINERHEMLDQK